MTAHSNLGASSAKRWMNCPGSNALIEHAPPEQPSKYAAEGTAAHWVGEQLIRQATDQPFVQPVVGMKCPENDYVIDADMLRYGAAYCGYVYGLSEGFPVSVEQRFDLSWIYPGMFGTSDASTYDPGTRCLHVVDLKYGKGEEVDAVDNPQGAFYAIGAAQASGVWETLEFASFHIYQPRITDTPSVWTLTRAELHAWAERFRLAAIAACQPGAPRVASVDACRWCRAKAICPENRAFATQQALAVQAARDHALYGMTAEQLAADYDLMREAKKWIEQRLTALHVYATQQANEMGVDVPGYKLVQKRSNRRWIDPTDAIALFRMFGHADEVIFEEPSIRSPAQLEKLIAKSDVASYITTDDNGVELVPMSDKRPAVAAKSRLATLFQVGE